MLSTHSHSKQINLQFYSTRSKYPPPACTHALSMTRFSMLYETFRRSCHKIGLSQSRQMTLAVFIKISKLKINLSNKNVVVSYPKTKLEDWHSEECKLRPTLTFELLTSNKCKCYVTVKLRSLQHHLAKAYDESRRRSRHYTYLTLWHCHSTFLPQMKWKTRTCHVLGLSICQVWWWYVQWFCVSMHTYTRM